MKRSCAYEKLCLPLLAAYLLFILSIGFLGFHFLNGQYTQRMRLAGNVAGAVLSQYPEAEAALISSLHDADGQYLADGFEMLSRYGYREELSIYNDLQYRPVLLTFSALLALLSILSAAVVGVHVILLRKSRRAQQERFLVLLDHCLAEDFSFLEQTEDINALFGESFTDALLKLGRRLKLKTQTLSEERDNTKALVTDISHQLKTPVSALKNCLIMSIEADTQAERDTFLEKCSLQLEKLETLMSALINISRLEASMITLHREKTALSDVLIDAVNTIYVKAMQKEITVEVENGSGENADDPASSLALPLDRKWTAEALANILDNAVKYSPARSAVTIRLHKLYSYVRIEIEDTGIGIPKAEYNQIFKRFYRGSAPTVRQSDGSGVGLYLARKIIEEQGGSVMVRPAPGQGSIFVVQLPLYP